jgi:transcription elongation factor/antiterminator RfaH
MPDMSLAQHAVACQFSYGFNRNVMRTRRITNKTTIEDTAQWYVIHTHPQQEDRAGSNLRVLGVPIFTPKIRERRYNQFTIIPSYVVKPLFPRYIFAQFKINDLYHKVRFTRGVYSVVSFGEGPTSIDEDIIALIQSNIKQDGFVRIDEEIKLGDRIMVKDGPLKNFAGIFEREMKAPDRIRILLETVSYQAHVEIERGMVKKAS